MCAEQESDFRAKYNADNGENCQSSLIAVSRLDAGPGGRGVGQEITKG